MPTFGGARPPVVLPSGRAAGPNPPRHHVRRVRRLARRGVIHGRPTSHRTQAPGPLPHGRVPGAFACAGSGRPNPTLWPPVEPGTKDAAVGRCKGRPAISEEAADMSAPHVPAAASVDGNRIAQITSGRQDGY